MRAWLIAVATALVLAGAATVVAAAPPPVAVTGGDEAGVTAALRAALASHVELVDDVREAAALVTVEVRAGKKKWTAKVSVYQAPDGKRLGGYEVKATKKKLAKVATAKAWKQLKKAIGKAKRPVAATVAVDDAAREPTPAPPPVEEDVVARADVEAGQGDRGDGLAVAAAAAPRDEQGAPWLAIAVEGRPFLRSLRYRDDLADVQRAYDLAAPAVGMEVTWRPQRRGALRHVAVHAELELAVGVNGSRTEDGMEFPTSASEWSAGVRAELPVAGWRWRVDLGFGEHRFAVDDDAVGDDLIPDTTYRWLRGALAVAAPLTGALTLDAGAGWRHLLGTGDLGSDAWFPRQTGAGIDAELGVTYQLAGPVALRGRLDMRRYFFAMHPEIGDAMIVGGATDQYLALVLGVDVALR